MIEDCKVARLGMESPMPTSESSIPPPKPRLPWNVYGYAVVASFSSFVYGYNTGIIAPAILFIPRTIPLSLLATSAIVSIILVGAALGSLGAGSLADLLGRKNAMAWNNALMLVAAVTAALGTSSGALLVSRFTLGLGVGVASVVPSLYITEIAPTHVRGKLGAINQLAGWTGVIMSYFVGYEIVTCTAKDLCWRFMFCSGAVLCVLHAILTISFLPDTPRWLVSRGHNRKAIDVLSRIYGSEHEAHVIHQHQLLLERRSHQEATCFSGAELSDSKYSRPLTIALFLQFFQQACGNSAVVYYSSLVFHLLGYSPRDALLFNALASIPQLLALILVVFSLDSQGRRPALLLSETGLVLSLLIMGVATTLTSLHQKFWTLLIGIILHRVFFAAGMGPVPGVWTAESLPFAIRGRGLSLAMAVNWMVNFMVTALFPLLFALTEPAYIYWGFGAITLIGVFFVTFCIKETKGVPLEVLETTPASKGNNVVDLESSNDDYAEPPPSQQSPPMAIRTPSPQIDIR